MDYSVGIVGSEQAKFTPETEAKAREIIRDIICKAVAVYTGDITVVSGHCHLGGIDIYTEEETAILQKQFPCLHLKVFPPAKLQWEGGYKQRNLAIAANSNKVHCITVARLPEGYSGMRFSECYHCKKNGSNIPHVKSGGCWTMWRCKKHKLWVIE